MQFRREKCHRTSTLYRLVFYEMIFITYFTTTTPSIRIWFEYCRTHILEFDTNRILSGEEITYQVVVANSVMNQDFKTDKVSRCPYKSNFFLSDGLTIIYWQRAYKDSWQKAKQASSVQKSSD
jgi:hypothetical protein